MPPADPKPDFLARYGVALAAAVMGLAALAAYHNSFTGPFTFDDLPSIRDNPSIRQWTTVFRPPSGMTVDARPVLNLSLALNYARSGLQVGSYHRLNLLFHFLAGLTLFGIVRRTLERRAKNRPGAVGGLSPFWFALVVALFWLLHPLQTEAVTYVVQRAESLMGLFYLLTLYCFIRFVDATPSFAPHGRASEGKKAGGNLWFGLMVICCLFGMGTKEVMVTAPVIVLLYDRTFISDSLRAAWTARSRLYLALASTWILLLVLFFSSPGRGGSSGFGHGIGWGQYLATQFPILLRYLHLALWPDALVFDYGPESVAPLRILLPSAAIVVAGAIASLIGLGRKSVWGFLGFWFFALLAPSSLIPGHLQMAADHRMYLALAAVAVAAVAVLDWLAARFAGPSGRLVFPVLAFALMVGTITRNADYATDLSLWSDTVAKRPGNPYARVNLGIAEFEAGHLDQAAAEFATAVRLQPDYAAAHANLGATLLRLGRPAEARREYATAVRLNPNNPDAENVLAEMDGAAGNWSGAAAHYAGALRSWPGVAAAHFHLAAASLMAGRADVAAAEYAAGLALQPNDVDARNNWGVALRRLGRRDEARAQFHEALRLRPDDRDARVNLQRLDAMPAH